MLLIQMTRFISIFFTVSILCRLAGIAAENDDRSGKNVLFIMTDDLNCNLGSYGHPLVKTPNIDKLASEGLLFENAYCQFPQCGSSRASFMTGLYPEQNGVTTLRRLFRDYVPDAVTMAQHFGESGYRVARVGKIYHYDNPNSIGTNGHDDAASWQIRINPIGRDKREEEQITSLKEGSFGGTLSWLAADGNDEEQTDGLVATESIKLMRDFAQEERPFFLGVGFYKPHTPYVAPKKYFDMYDPEKIEVPRVPADYFKSIPSPAVKTLHAKKDQVDLDEGTARKAIHAYYATISFMDAQVGRVLAALDELGLRDNTIVLFSSDHGYHMGEHGHYQKMTLFEDADRVPLIMTTPNMKTRGQRTDSLVEMIDFYRTLAELAGLPEPPKYVQGKSLVSILEEPEAEVRSAAFTQMANGYTIRTDRYRYTRWKSGEPNHFELYDRLDDPHEMVNLANDANYEDVAERLSRLLDERIEAAITPVEGLAFVPPEPGDNGYTREELPKSENMTNAPLATVTK